MKVNKHSRICSNNDMSMIENVKNYQIKLGLNPKYFIISSAI